MRRHRSIHEVDISDLEAALRSDEPGKVHETPREEIARLRKMELEPQHYDVDINKEVRTGAPRGCGHGVAPVLEGQSSPCIVWGPGAGVSAASCAWCTGSWGWLCGECVC